MAANQSMPHVPTATELGRRGALRDYRICRMSGQPPVAAAEDSRNYAACLVANAVATVGGADEYLIERYRAADRLLAMTRVREWKRADRAALKTVAS